MSTELRFIKQIRPVPGRPDQKQERLMLQFREWISVTSERGVLGLTSEKPGDWTNVPMSDVVEYFDAEGRRTDKDGKLLT